VLKIYKSSAGSGKTFTLVKEYLKYCLPNPDRFRYVVAITFTNASAAEMKDRILKALRELSEGKAEDIRDQLHSEGITTQQLKNAPLLLEKILYNYSLFNISTIDKFFHRIIRSFNRELDISSDFELFIDTDEALDFAVDQFLYRSRELPEIHKLLVDFVREKIANSQGWNIRSDLYKMAKELLKDNALQLHETELDTVLDYIRDLKKLTRDFETEMDRIARDILKHTEDHGLVIEDFKYGHSGVFSFIKKSLKEYRDYEPKVRFVKGLTLETEWYAKDSINAHLIQQALHTGLLPMSLQLHELHQKDYSRYITAREILKNIYTFSVYEELNRMLKLYREEKNAVLISDFTKILSGHIANEDITFVYSRIGNRYDHYLIDEFQDTSVLQWQSLKPLIENAVAQGSGCLLVGDSKQAIYRWRGGSVELIEKQVVEIDFPAYSEKYNLNRNFRSRPTIVDFNNAFFDKVAGLFSSDTAEYQLMQQIFEDASQKAKADLAEPGYAEFNFITKEGRKNDSFTGPSGLLVLEQVKAVLHDGYALKDITVLVRDTKGANLAAALLHDAGLPFITQDTLKLDYSPTVRFLLSLLNYINHPEDSLSLSEVLFLYIQYFYPESVNGSNQPLILSGSISENTLPENFRNNLKKLAAMPVYEIVEELVAMFHLDAPDAYLQRFQDAVLEFTIKEKGGITAFLEWWEKGKFTVILPENQDAIRIMTIHKAKGLEFPVVMIPYADWDFSNHQNLIWVHPKEEPFNKIPYLPVNYSAGLKESLLAEDFYREEALTAIDNLNLLYVAFTRAKHRLYVNTAKIKKQPENGIKNTAALINSVLNPGGDKLFFGKESPVVNTDASEEMKSSYLEEYPVHGRLTADS
jgi:ATP-dependent helicase/nuclease subunit A